MPRRTQRPHEGRAVLRRPRHPDARDSESIPKPMIPIGDQPILWHIMQYYATSGTRTSSSAWATRPRSIKEYFLNYNEALSNDFVLERRRQAVELLARDIQDWRSPSSTPG